MGFNGFNRQDIIDALTERDGLSCRYPGEEHALDPNGTGHNLISIDHWVPQAYGKANGWTFEEINALENLRLFCRRHNSLKGERLPNPDGTLPPRAEDLRPVHQRRADKSSRADMCDTCMSGRLLLVDDVCPDCGRDEPQPRVLPKYLQVSPKECSHGWGKNPELYCWSCWLGYDERRPAIESVLDVDGAES